MTRFAAFILAAALAAAFSSAQAFAQEKPIALKPAGGWETVANNCDSCHSLDYIVMNSSFLSAEKWQGEVSKMIKAFGAPIDEADARTIAEYLKENYGAER